MDIKKQVNNWFKKWEEGNFLDLPISEHFRHTSPYGTINGKMAYINLVKANKDKFLGYRFQIHDEIYNKDRACVRYTAIQGSFHLEVSEWYFFKADLIEEIVSYYNIEGEISNDRKLSYPR